MSKRALPTQRPELQTTQTFCRICEALCGLEMDVQDGEVIDIRPDSSHVATGGFACVKGLRQHKLFGSPDRLKYPLKKVRTEDGYEHVRISWSQALEEIGQKVRAERAVHPDRVAMYVGTAAGFGVLHPIFAQGFMSAVGSKSMYSSSTQDCANKFAAARELYGFPFTQPFPDVDHTECLIVVGANPVVSKWSFLQVSNPAERLRAIEERGALFFVDPRRTESAKVAGEHVSIRPATDVFFYLAMLNEIVARSRSDASIIDRDKLGPHVRELDEALAVAEGWTPERCAEVTGIDAGTLRRLVDAYLKASRKGGAALYSSTGVNMGGQGALCFWLQELINCVTGNLDRRGGTLVGQGVIDFPAFGKKTGTLLRDDRSRIGDFISNNDTFPGGIVADEILTPGERQVRALFVTGGNPLITMAGAGRLRDAFESLECLVVLDIFPSESAAVADYVLPCTSPIERPDLPFVFPLMLGLQSRPYLQATEAVVQAGDEQWDEATIYLELCRAAGLPIFGSRAAQLVFDGMLAGEKLRGRRGLPQKLLLDLLLRATKQGSFESLLRETHGRARPDHQPGSFLGKRVVTDDGRVHLMTKRLAEAAQGLDALHEHELQSIERGELRLITKRHVKTHNSWTHNLEGMTPEGTNFLYMHPDDMARVGVQEKDLVDVTSATATVRVPCKRNSDLRVGSVALPHGWGHQHAKGLRHASQTRGVNVNLLAADGPDALERLGGMARLTGIPVTVKKAAGEQAHTWSGIDTASPSR